MQHKSFWPARGRVAFALSSSMLSSSLIILSALAALSPALSVAAPAEATSADAVDTSSIAQTTPRKRRASAGALEEIVVTGSKVNVMDAQEMKRDADTMMDAISADQIGLLPDRSALDAMQRLPGVAIERFASPNDPDHYSVEGSDIILRGMTQTRSEFNGRDSFSANTGRGLSYQDIPPELLGSIQVFKNQTADMIEGGIG